MVRELVYELDPFAVYILNLSRATGWAVTENRQEDRVDVVNTETGEWIGNLPMDMLHEQLHERAAGAD